MTNRTVDRFRPQRFGILPRVGWIAGILIAETLVRSYWIQEGGAHEPTGPAKALYIVQSWSLRFVIAYVAAWSILVRMRDVSIVARSASLRQLPVRVQWLALHLVLLVAFGFLSVALYDAGSPIAFTVAAIAWHACCAGLVFSLLAAMAPMSIWHQAVSQPASLYLYALLAALIAVVATRPLQLSWEPVVHITYWAVDQVLAPFMPGLRSNSNTMSIGTPTFAIVVSERCSGLEGVGLIAAFCVTWFWYGRREFIFSRSLIVLPVAAFLVFSLNVLRIATLVAIGNAGYPQMAMVGFHSQAGWIAFNCAAFAVAAVSYRIPWLRRGVAPRTRTSA